MVDLNSNGGRYEFASTGIVIMVIVNYDPYTSPKLDLDFELYIPPVIPPPPTKVESGIITYFKESDSTPIIIGIAVGIVVVLIIIIIILIIFVRRYVRRNRVISLK